MVERVVKGGRPARISREAIVAAASMLVERDGVDALTMRKLADEVGATPMALYHHVRDKSGLLLLLLDHHAQAVEEPVWPDEPREKLIAAAVTMHDVLAARPWVAEVLTSDDLLSVSALWLPEAIVDAAVACGLTERQAVHAYRSIWYYTAGEIIIRAGAARRRAAEGAPPYRDQVFAEIDAERYPRLASVAGEWVELAGQDTYREGLEALVAGLLPSE